MSAMADEIIPNPQAARAVYDAHARAYDAQRSRALHEARWLQRFASQVPAGGHLLDLGCGSGRPIAGWLIGEGFRLTGADFSEPMLALARARWPRGDWRLSDMRTLDFPERFDGIIGWNSFFHLTPEEQRACLPRLARHLVPGGVLMVTVGPEDGTTAGCVDTAVVYHASLAVSEYARILEGCGMRLTAFLAEDPDCEKHSILMARRTV